VIVQPEGNLHLQNYCKIIRFPADKRLFCAEVDDFQRYLPTAGASANVWSIWRSTWACFDLFIDCPASFILYVFPLPIIPFHPPAPRRHALWGCSLKSVITASVNSCLKGPGLVIECAFAAAQVCIIAGNCCMRQQVYLPKGCMAFKQVWLKCALHQFRSDTLEIRFNALGV
jgi:hypothetical protein